MGASLGLCNRALTAEEKAERVKEFCRLTRENEKQAIRILECENYSVNKAMSNWAGMQNAIVIEDENDENMPNAGNGQRVKGSESFDVVHTLQNSSYGRISKLIRRIDSIAKVTLPTIVVVGSESAGKSSTLERVAGFSLFPRDAKICTRMPIKLSMITSEEGSGKVTLKFPGRNDMVVTEQSTAAAVGKLMHEVVPPGKGVIDTQLTIEVCTSVDSLSGKSYNFKSAAVGEKPICTDA